MNFEEALFAELKTISILNNKISPLYIIEGSTPPYLIYRKSGVTYRKTLNGTSSKREVSYDIIIITKKYEDLQSISDTVIDKLLSFWGRNIGTGGPYIEDVTIEHMGDRFEVDTDLVRADISLKAKF